MNFLPKIRMGNVKYFLLLFLFTIYGNCLSQDSTFLFSFRITECPLYLPEEVDSSKEEYFVLTLNYLDSANIKITNDIFWGKFDLHYNSKYLDSNIIVNLVKYPCCDTMLIVFLPRNLLNVRSSVYNIYIDNIPYFKGKYYINIPSSEQYSTIEPIILNPYNGILYNDITKFQDWLFNLRYNFRINKLNVLFCFRILDKKNRIITNKLTGYSLTYDILFPGRDGRIDLDFLNVTYDSLNNCWCSSFAWGTFGFEKIIFNLNDERHDNKMSISLEPRLVSQYNCSYANIFIDSVRFEPGVFSVTFPKDKKEWNKCTKINLLRYSQGFEDLTRFQYWNR
jgi:hypothetical protein